MRQPPRVEMIDECSVLRGFFLDLDGGKLSLEEKDKVYTKVEKLISSVGKEKLSQAIKGIKVADILLCDISVESTSIVFRSLSVLTIMLETKPEIINGRELLSKLVIILQNNLPLPNATALNVKALQCINLLCPLVSSLGKEGPSITTILLQCMVANDNAAGSVKLHALFLFTSLLQYKLLQVFDSNNWLKILISFVFDGDEKIREAAVQAVFAFKPQVTGEEDYLDILANNIVPMKYSKMLIEMIVADKNWAVIWRLIVGLLGKRLHNSSALVNSLLAVEEKAFKTFNLETKKEAFNCWNSLLLNFALEPNVLCSEKRVKLLTIPLRANNCRNGEVAIVKLNVWWNVIKLLKSDVTQFSEMVLTPFLSFCYGNVGEAIHMPSSGQNRLNGSATSDSCVKSYPNVRVPSLHALCEILSKSAGMPLPSEMAKDLVVQPLMEPPITCQKVFSSLSRILTHCLGEAVLLEGYTVQQTPYVMHCWHSLMKLISQGSGEVLYSTGGDFVSRDVKNVAMVKELLRLLANMVDTSSSLPEGKSIIPVILSMIESMVAGDYALPPIILNSHVYGVGQMTVMHSTPALYLCLLLLVPAFSSDKDLHPRIKDVFTKTLKIGFSGILSPLTFSRAIVKKMEKDTADHCLLPVITYFQEMWVILASHLSDVIDKDGSISEGNDSGHDFQCIHGMLTLPISHVLKIEQSQEANELQLKAWIRLFKLFMVNSQLDVIPQSSEVVEELCKKILSIFKKSSASWTYFANGIQYILVLYQKSYVDSLWKDIEKQMLKGDKSNKLRNSQHLIVFLINSVFAFVSAMHDDRGNSNKVAGNHKIFMHFLSLIFTLASSNTHMNFALEKGVKWMSFYLKLTSNSQCATCLRSEVVTTWEKFLVYTEKKVLVSTMKAQSIVNSLSPVFLEAFRHPIDRVMELTRIYWNKSLGQFFARVDIPKHLSDVLDDALKDNSNSEDVFGNIVSLEKRDNILSALEETGNKTKSKRTPAELDGVEPNIHSSGKNVVFKVIPPKHKILVLTEHQKEMSKVRGVDIPALYQDLTQDSMSQCSSQEAVVMPQLQQETSLSPGEDANPPFSDSLPSKTNVDSVEKVVEMTKSVMPFLEPVKELNVSITLDQNNVTKCPGGSVKLNEQQNSLLTPDRQSAIDDSLVANETKVMKRGRRTLKQTLMPLVDGSEKPQIINTANEVTPSGSPVKETRPEPGKVNGMMDGNASTSKDASHTVMTEHSTLSTGENGQPMTDAPLGTGMSDAAISSTHTSKRQNDFVKEQAQDPSLSKVPNVGIEQDPCKIPILSNLDESPCGSSSETLKMLRHNNDVSSSEVKPVSPRIYLNKKLARSRCTRSIKHGSKENESPLSHPEKNDLLSHENSNGPCKKRQQIKQGDFNSVSDASVEGGHSSKQNVVVCDSEAQDTAILSKSHISTSDLGQKPSAHGTDKNQLVEEEGKTGGSESITGTHQDKLTESSERAKRGNVGPNDSAENMKGEVGLSNIHISSPRKISVDEFNVHQNHVGGASSLLVPGSSTIDIQDSPKTRKHKLSPGSPRTKPGGNTSKLDNWVIVTRRNSEGRSPSESLRRQKAQDGESHDIPVINLDSDSESVTSDDSFKDIKPFIYTNSEDLVDSSQDPYDYSQPQPRGIMKKCSINLARVSDILPEEVAFIQYEGRTLRCNLSPKKEDTNDGDAKKVAASSPVVTNVFSPRSTNTRCARILNMAQGNKEKSTVEENPGSPLRDVGNRVTLQNGDSNKQCSPLSQSVDLESGNSTPPPRKSRRIRPLHIGNVSPQYHSMEIGQVANESEVPIHSYSPNASPGGSLMKKRKLPGEDSISPSSKKARRVSFADPIVSRQVEYCVPESERMFKKRSVHRCLELICVTSQDSPQFDSLFGQLQQSIQHHSADTLRDEEVLPTNENMTRLSPEVTNFNSIKNIVGEQSYTTSRLKPVEEGLKEVQVLEDMEAEAATENPKKDEGGCVTSARAEPNRTDAISVKTTIIHPNKKGHHQSGSELNDSGMEIEIHSVPSQVSPLDYPHGSGGNPEKTLSSPQSSILVDDGSSKILHHSDKGLSTSESPDFGKESSSESPLLGTGTDFLKSHESHNEFLQDVIPNTHQMDTSQNSDSSCLSSFNSDMEEPSNHKLNSQEEAYSPLRDCLDPLSTVIGNLTTRLWRERCRSTLEKKNIRTIGDLSRLTEDFVERIPFKAHKWENLRAVLKEYHLHTTNKPEKKSSRKASSDDAKKTEEIHTTNKPEKRSSRKASSDDAKKTEEMTVDGVTQMQDWRDILSKMSPKDILKELNVLNLTDAVLQEVGREKHSIISSDVHQDYSRGQAEGNNLSELTEVSKTFVSISVGVSESELSLRQELSAKKSVKVTETKSVSVQVSEQELASGHESAASTPDAVLEASSSTSTIISELCLPSVLKTHSRKSCEFTKTFESKAVQVSDGELLSGRKSLEVLLSLHDSSDLKNALCELPQEKLMQFIKLCISAAHEKMSLFDGSIDMAARKIFGCVLCELMKVNGTPDVVKQFLWVFQNTLFSKEYLKVIPSLLNNADSSVISEIILNEENIMENIQNDMPAARGLKMAIEVLSQKNISFLPEEDIDRLNDILDKYRTCAELFERYTHVIRNRITGSNSR